MNQIDSKSLEIGYVLNQLVTIANAKEEDAIESYVLNLESILSHTNSVSDDALKILELTIEYLFGELNAY